MQVCTRSTGFLRSIGFATGFGRYSIPVGIRAIAEDAQLDVAEGFIYEFAFRLQPLFGARQIGSCTPLLEGPRHPPRSLPRVSSKKKVWQQKNEIIVIEK